MEEVKYLIIGAGPTGLGAAHRLKELGETDFVILEKHTYPGGLSASFIDEKGFTWDVGGHVIFSHYIYFDELIKNILESDYYAHERKAFIRIGETWVPYPFQNNLRYLPPEQRWECLEGLLNVNASSTPAKDFADWIQKTFGHGISRLFMTPYNEKVWAVPLKIMDWNWIGERISVVDFRRAVRNLALEKDDVAWGPNNTFLFPRQGGTGTIFRRLAERHSGHIQYGREVRSIHMDQKEVITKCGKVFKYNFILNTMPLDYLVLKVIYNAPENIRKAAMMLKHNSVNVVGIGIEENPSNSMCWMYFPEVFYPFYRVTNFHNYSPQNTAQPGRQKALMAEISFSEYSNIAKEDLIWNTESGLLKAGLMKDLTKIVSRWRFEVDYAYPIPTKNRDAALQEIQTWLAKRDVYSRGRFGGWKYEVGNMDHSVMQGVEWVNFVVRGKEETTYRLYF